MLFSIIVPIYNVEEYLERCILSLINQSYTDFEIILVDDGSKDKSGLMCDEYKEKDKRIKVIHKKNGGLSDARNAGIESASGKYLIFVDADDYISLNTCEEFAKYANGNFDILMGNAWVEGDGKGVMRSADAFAEARNGKDYLKVLLAEDKMPMAAWLNVYRKSFLLENDLMFKKGILHEDEQFTPRAMLKADRVINTNILFYHYVVRNGSITTSIDRRKNAKDFYMTCCELEKIYINIEDDDLRKILLNSLVDKYLSLYCSGMLDKYGKEFYHKEFMWRNACKVKTKMKSLIFLLSPKIYCLLNRSLRAIKNKYICWCIM